MKILSLCGVDGSGKTTLIQNLTPQSQLTTLRCPQYFESGEHRVNRLALMLENSGKVADQTNNVPLKAVTLFLQMSLYGKVERDHLTQHPHSTILVRERDPIIDTLVYAPLYTQVLSLHDLTYPREWNEDEELLSHLKEMHQILPLGFQELSLHHLRQYILRFFQLPAVELPGFCQKLFQNRIATDIVLLSMDSLLMAERLRLKTVDGKGAREHHENQDLLLKIQAGMKGAAQQLGAHFKWNIQEFPLSLENQNTFHSRFTTWLETRF